MRNDDVGMLGGEGAKRKAVIGRGLAVFDHLKAEGEVLEGAVLLDLEGVGHEDVSQQIGMRDIKLIGRQHRYQGAFDDIDIRLENCHALGGAMVAIAPFLPQFRIFRQRGFDEIRRPDMRQHKHRGLVDAFPIALAGMDMLGIGPQLVKRDPMGIGLPLVASESHGLDSDHVVVAKAERHRLAVALAYMRNLLRRHETVHLYQQVGLVQDARYGPQRALQVSHQQAGRIGLDAVAVHQPDLVDQRRLPQQLVQEKTVLVGAVVPDRLLRIVTDVQSDGDVYLHDLRFRYWENFPTTATCRMSLATLIHFPGNSLCCTFSASVKKRFLSLTRIASTARGWRTISSCNLPWATSSSP